MPTCPKYTSARTVKNGRIHTGKQRFLCQDFGRQLVVQATKKVIVSATRELIARVEADPSILEKRELVLKRLQSRFAAIPAEVNLADELIAKRRLISKVTIEPSC